jgi:hypothetical protein
VSSPLDPPADLARTLRGYSKCRGLRIVLRSEISQRLQKFLLIFQRTFSEKKAPSIQSHIWSPGTGWVPVKAGATCDPDHPGRDPAKGETGVSAPMVMKDKVVIGISGGEYGVRGSITAYNIKDGSRIWRGYSMGPDSDTLIDPQKTTHLGKPVGPDSGTNTWEGAISGRSAGELLGAGFPTIRS